MLHRLAANRDGVLVLAGRPRPGKGIWGRPTGRAGQVVFARHGTSRCWSDTAVELGGGRKGPPVSPLALTRRRTLPNSYVLRVDLPGHFKAALGLGVHLEGVADYTDRLPLEPNYVLAAGQDTQAFYLLDSRWEILTPGDYPMLCTYMPSAPCPLISLVCERWVAGKHAVDEGRRRARAHSQALGREDIHRPRRSAEASGAVHPSPRRPLPPSRHMPMARRPPADEPETDDPGRSRSGTWHSTALPARSSPRSCRTSRPTAQLCWPSSSLPSAAPSAAMGMRSSRATTTPVNFYVAIVGASSASRKGTSWARIRGLFKRADPAWMAERVKNGL